MQLFLNLGKHNVGRKEGRTSLNFAFIILNNKPVFYRLSSFFCFIYYSTTWFYDGNLQVAIGCPTSPDRVSFATKKIKRRRQPGNGDRPTSWTSLINKQTKKTDRKWRRLLFLNKLDKQTKAFLILQLRLSDSFTLPLPPYTTILSGRKNLMSNIFWISSVDRAYPPSSSTKRQQVWLLARE